MRFLKSCGMSDCQRPLKSCVTRLISLYIEESRIMRKLRTYACRLRVADRADERHMVRMFWWTGRDAVATAIGGPIGSSPSPTPTGAGLRSPAGLGTNTPGRACCYPGPGHKSRSVHVQKRGWVQACTPSQKRGWCGNAASITSKAPFLSPSLSPTTAQRGRSSHANASCGPRFSSRRL